MFTWSTSGSDVVIFILTLVGVIEAAQHKVDADPRVHACGSRTCTSGESALRFHKNAPLERRPLTFLFP